MSNSLQVGLAIAGGVVLAGIIAYNTWSTRRSEPRQPQPEGGQAPGPAQPSELRIEPALGQGMAGWGDVPAAAHATVAPATPPTGQAEQAAPATRGGVRGGHLDALIDSIATIALDGRIVSGEALLAPMPATRRVGSKPFVIEAQNDIGGQWEVPVAGQRYRAVQAGVQLANRTGALNEIEFSEFVAAVQRYADAIGAAAECPDMLQEVARARELDQFAAEHDAQLGFCLRTRGAAWGHAFVQQQAGKLGFLPGAVAGRMVLPSHEVGQPLLTLAFDQHAAMQADPAHAAVGEVTISLDVPQVSRAMMPFEILREAARELAEAMDALITDTAGQILTPPVIDLIGQDLNNLYDRLEAHDLAPGSPQARRLFS